MTLSQAGLSATPNFGNNRVSALSAAIATASRSDGADTSFPPPWKTRALGDDVLEELLEAPLAVGDTRLHALLRLTPFVSLRLGPLVDRVLRGRVGSERVAHALCVEAREKDVHDRALDAGRGR